MATHKVSVYVTTDDRTAVELGTTLADVVQNVVGVAGFDGVKVKAVHEPLLNERTLETA